MKINIIAVGKIKDSYYVEAIQEYAKRISRFADFKIIEVPESPQGKSEKEQQIIESKSLLEKAQGFVIALDPKGSQFTSEDFAQFVKNKCVDGVSEFSFLIGGSYGLSDEIKKKSNMLFSFSKQTFPHQLFRVMLSEQIYRTLTIINGVPYHK